MRKKEEEEERKMLANPFSSLPASAHGPRSFYMGPTGLATLPHLKYSSSSRIIKRANDFLSFPLPSSLTISTLTMESLSDTLWDVVISGTGLQQSLLAL